MIITEVLAVKTLQAVWTAFKISGRLTLFTSELACSAVRLMRLFKAISMAALFLPVDVFAQVNPRDINDFNVEPLPHHSVVVTSEVASTATPEEIAQVLAGLDKEIATDPKNAKAYYSRGAVRLCTGDDTGAISDLRRALTLDPKNAETNNLLGEAQSDKKDYSGAVATYSHALALDPKNPDIYDSRAWAKKEKGDFDGAIADFSKVIALDPPTASRGYMGRGGAKFAKHDFDGAIADLTKVIELDPKNAAGAYGLRGNAKQLIGDLNGAKADWAASTHDNAH
jgi:cytochrome c-type biogenesis protein CcmH/NrfG